MIRASERNTLSMPELYGGEKTDNTQVAESFSSFMSL